MQRKINRAILCVLLIALLSCSGNRLTTLDMSVILSVRGEITGIQLSGNRQTKPFGLATSLQGCKVEGAVVSRKNKDGSFEFEKTVVNDSLNNSCVITEHYFPTPNSIRCELTIEGKGEPWGASIETKLHYPVKDGETKLWTSWGAPQFDSLKVSNNLHHALRKFGPRGKKDNSHTWIDPLIPVPFANALYYYGAPYFQYTHTRVGFIPFQENLICIPMASILDEGNNSGLTIALSPEDNIIDLTMKTSDDGTITFSRLFNRISKGKVVKFSFDIVAHQNDWRCGLDWMQTRYPEYFFPENKLANQMGGTAAYSSYSMESLNFDVDKMKKMAFTVNWQASFDFPYMGMYLPPVKRNEKWRRFGGDLITISAMDDFAKKYRNKGFYVLNYFNVTEFGAKVKYPPLSEQVNKPDSELWKDCNELLYSKFRKAILPIPEKSIKDPKLKNAPVPVPYYTWEGGIAMDCGDSIYSNFLLNQARRHINEIPNSYGICIDRLDWLRMFNERADDGITWYGGKPVRSLVTSWKNLSPKLASIMHGANKVIFANNHSKRIDILKDIDGLFDEFTYSGSSLNLTSFMCLSKPALGWTDVAETIRREGGDWFFQKYLYMGIFPMCPFPNNDHSITQSDDVDQLYLDYGPLMKLMQGREWVLKPHIVRVKDQAAKVNIFKIKGGYSVPVVYGEKDKIEVVLTDLEKLKEPFFCKTYHPGCEQPVNVAYHRVGKTITINVPLIRGCAMLYLTNDK
jgi:hypothetical protein